ncbi:DoxX family protein [Deinococcus sp. Arct2-2]|jgi:putative oxidoreductase|uniref:DoxX family protein n=1 Tax=Deinococcus sp. Arct2-2 TaxID=2568653 RepID=UPI0010A3B2F4|nr:DoxX family protein [Deinococcus sp. Arct2-2]THF68769.1 DoxX family protein [Deinococcus sp. Arct2-2]
MGVTGFIGRALLASIFIKNGLDHLQNPEPIVRAAKGAEVPEPEIAVRANSAVMLGAGAMLALGVAPRFASTALAASLIPTTVIGHPFWDKSGKERSNQQAQFLKNLALFGALLAVGSRK